MYTEEKLWDYCREGDIKAFEQMYVRFYALLYNYGLKLVPNKDFVQDSIQDLFIKLIQNHTQLSPTPYIKGYLLKALRNKITDSLSGQKEFEDITGYENNFYTDDSFNELFKAEWGDGESSEQLMRSFRALTKNQQEIIYLYYISELSHEEIADLLNINYQSSKNLLSRAIIKLRTLYYQTFSIGE